MDHGKTLQQCDYTYEPAKSLQQIIYLSIYTPGNYVFFNDVTTAERDIRNTFGILHNPGNYFYILKCKGEFAGILMFLPKIRNGEMYCVANLNIIDDCRTMKWIPVIRKLLKEFREKTGITHVEAEIKIQNKASFLFTKRVGLNHDCTKDGQHILSANIDSLGD